MGRQARDGTRSWWRVVAILGALGAALIVVAVVGLRWLDESSTLRTGISDEELTTWPAPLDVLETTRDMQAGSGFTVEVDCVVLRSQSGSTIDETMRMVVDEITRRGVGTMAVNDPRENFWYGSKDDDYYVVGPMDEALVPNCYPLASRDLPPDDRAESVLVVIS